MPKITEAATGDVGTISRVLAFVFDSLSLEVSSQTLSLPKTCL